MLTFRCSWDAPSHLLWCLERAHQQTHQLARPRVRSRMMKLMVVTSWSKSHWKSKNHQKSNNLKGLKSRKGYRFGGTFTEAPILRQLNAGSDSFSSSFCQAQKLSQYHVWSDYCWSTANRAADAFSIIDKAQLMELLMCCYILPRRSQT